MWAPDVIKIGDWYNLYITVHNGGAHTAIIAYRSKCPSGPFRDRQIILRSEDDGRFEVIDAEVVKDVQSGRVWLFFGHGDLRRLELTPDGYATMILRSEKEDEFFGPGHNGEIFTVKEGRTFIFYHCHWKGTSASGHSSTVWKGPAYVPRPLFLQEIFWDDAGWPYFGNGGRPQKICAL